MTLALTALAYAIAFRWTAFTGGENGLGGVVRGAPFGLDLGDDRLWYGVVALVALAVVVVLQRFVRSPIGTVLVAVRENETRAQFLGYPTNAYKLVAFTVAATFAGLAGALIAFHHRFASADPLNLAFSGELLAMVIIGGMRSFLGPALGALFYVLFREYLSTWTADWLLYFGLLFVGFILFSPTGLVGVADRLLAPFRKATTDPAAMGGRAAATDVPLPASLARGAGGRHGPGGRERRQGLRPGSSRAPGGRSPSAIGRCTR